MVPVLAGCVPSLTGFMSSVEGFLSVEEMEKEGRGGEERSSLFLELVLGAWGQARVEMLGSEDALMWHAKFLVTEIVI
jgi:hypothetical protein